jgi:hypothetical protein
MLNLCNIKINIVLSSIYMASYLQINKNVISIILFDFLKFISFSFMLFGNIEVIINLIIIQNLYKYKYIINLYLFKKNQKMNFSYENNSIRVEGAKELAKRLKALINLNSLTID